MNTKKTSRINKLEKKLAETNSELAKMKQKYYAYKSRYTFVNGEYRRLQESNRRVCESLNDLERKYKKEVLMNKAYLSELKNMQKNS